LANGGYAGDMRERSSERGNTLLIVMVLILGMTLLSLHNEHFIIKLVDDIRGSIEDGSFFALKKSWLKRYYGTA
jgi:tRNA-guanine family transglycosylase